MLVNILNDIVSGEVGFEDIEWDKIGCNKNMNRCLIFKHEVLKIVDSYMIRVLSVWDLI